MIRSFTLRAALVLLFAAASCQRDPLRGLDADATAPDTLDFGAVAVGQSKALPLSVTNTGALQLFLQDAQVGSPFSVESKPPSIEAGNSGSLLLIFSPRSIGQFEQPLILALSSTRTPSLSVKLMGSAAAGSGNPDGGSDAGTPDGGHGDGGTPDGGSDAGTPDGGHGDGGTPDGGDGGTLLPASLAVAPDHLAYSVLLPVTPDAKTLTVSNTGDLPLSWSAASDGTEPQLSATAGTLAGHQSVQLSAALVIPQNPVDSLRHLTFTATAASAVAPVVVPVQISYTQPTPGTATMLVEPSSLTFTAPIPALPQDQSFNIHNTGTVALHWSLGLGNAGSLAVAPTSGTLQPSAIAQVTVGVPTAPAQPTAYSQTVTVKTQETASQDVSVSVSFTKPGPPPPPPQYGGSVWPKFHQGNTCTGLSSVSTNTHGNLRFKVPFGVARMFHADGTYVGSPSLADDGTVYQLGEDSSGGGALTAFEPLHGAVQWSTPVTAPSSITPSIEATPTVVKSGAIFVMTGSESSAVAHFFKLTRAGLLAWQDPGNYGDGFDSSPAIGADGVMYLAYDDDPSIILYDQGGPLHLFPQELARVPLTGSYRLRRTHIETQSAAVADDGTAYWAGDGLLWSLTRSQVLWSFDATAGAGVSIKSRSAPTLTVDGKMVVFAYADTDFNGDVTTVITAVSAGAGGGTQLWQHKLGPTTPSISVGPSSWSTVDDRAGLSSPAQGPDGTLYLGHADGLYAFDPATGDQKWHAAGAMVASSPAVGADGTVFYGAMDGTLSAVDASGHPRWSVQTGGQVNSSPAIGADGAIFVASDDGYLYAVE